MTKQANIQKWVEKLSTSDRYKYNKDTVTSLLYLIAEGYGRFAACKKVGIHYTTLLGWLDNKPGFSDVFKKAETVGRQIKKEVCEQKILKEESWQAAAWWLERNFPDEYGLRSKFEHTIQMPKIIVENDEQAAKLKELGEK